MIKKGIILAGGMGTRMSPLTKAVNKQLLPIYDKPLIFYPLSILMLANIRDILIIVNKGQLDQYKKILPDGENLVIKISYKEQDKPRGLPDAFIIGEKFIKNNNVALILGDNFFYGQNLTKNLINNSKLENGARVLLHKVLNPELFGVAKLNKKNHRGYRAWQLSSWRRLIKKIITQTALDGVITGGKNEKEFIDQLNVRDSRVHNLCGKTSLPNLYEVMKDSECVIANDSG